MTLTIVNQARLVTGGVDTHADVHVAAALDGIGGLLGVAEFPVTPAGYARLLDWLASFGTVVLVGVEGTGSYGAGLARYLDAAGIRALMVAKRTARAQRTQTINQARALILTGPDDIRARFTGQTPAGLVTELTV